MDQAADVTDSAGSNSEARTSSQAVRLAKEARTSSASFFIGRKRAMVSLGPPGRNPCTYRCAFCYTQANFPSYPNFTIEQIEAWLIEKRDEFEIVYVSGDTDSFAPPRQSMGVELVEKIASVGKDLLFTTRAEISDRFHPLLARLAKDAAANGRLFVACISISQLHQPRLEPRPIPSPEARIRMLERFHRLGITTALTIRPFIPSVPAEEYAEIVDIAGPFSDLVIGGDWYVDTGGVLLERTSAAIDTPVVPERTSPEPVRSLYFSTSSAEEWVTQHHPKAEAAVRKACSVRNIPFFMGSEDAIGHLRLAPEAKSDIA